VDERKVLQHQTSVTYIHKGFCLGAQHNEPFRQTELVLTQGIGSLQARTTEKHRELAITDTNTTRSKRSQAELGKPTFLSYTHSLPVQQTQCHAQLTSFMIQQSGGCCCFLPAISLETSINT
jgi:hypothetical protein